MTKELFGNMLRDMLSFWIIGTASLCVGLLLNQFRDKPLSLVYQTKVERLQLAVTKIGISQLTRRAPEALPVSLSLDEFRSFAEQKRGLVLDARPELFHRLGHVPGAISLPREALESGYAKLKAQLESDKSQPLVVYCSGISCEDSIMVQQALVKLGYTHVSIFRGGWDEWSDAGLPVEKAP
jgi:rhodanese-related sulfurtransferase